MYGYVGVFPSAQTYAELRKPREMCTRGDDPWGPMRRWRYSAGKYAQVGTFCGKYALVGISSRDACARGDIFRRRMHRWGYPARACGSARMPASPEDFCARRGTSAPARGRLRPRGTSPRAQLRSSLDGCALLRGRYNNDQSEEDLQRQQDVRPVPEEAPGVFP